ncbi:MAG: ABC transporter permease [Ilumatobacter sp.]
MSDQQVREALWDVHQTQPLKGYIAEIWKRRHYVRNVASNELRTRQVNSVLGNIWHILNPALQIGIYWLVFGQLLRVDRGIDNFIAYLAVGIFVFGFTQRATTSGASSIVNNRGLLMALPFPRAMLPVTSTLTEAFATIGPVTVIYLSALLTGETPSPRWLLLPVVMLVQATFNLGAAFVAARLTSIIRDTTQVLPLFFRLLFYSSGLIFDPTKIEQAQDIQFLFDFNPLYCFVSLARWCIFGDDLRAHLILIAIGWAIVMLTFGIWWFRRGEESYGRE